MKPSSIPTALIADDDAQIRSDLVSLLTVHWPGLQVVAEADNGADAWDLFLEREPDYCFLDVRMPGLTGLEVGQRIRGQARLVLMATARDPALDAMKLLGALHLCKPFDMDQAMALIADLQATRDPARPARQTDPEHAVTPVRRGARIDSIPGALVGEPHEINIGDIVYLETDGRFTRVVQRSGDVQVRQPLKQLIPRLDPREFWQIHRHIVVNRRHIERALMVEGGQIVMTLRDRSERLPIGSHFLERFQHLTRSEL